MRARELDFSSDPRNRTSENPINLFITCRRGTIGNGIKTRFIEYVPALRSLNRLCPG
jgi:hypothetical protein